MDFAAIATLLKGWRTHVAVISAILMAFATFCGLLPSTQGQALAVGLTALAVSCMRLSQSDFGAKLDVIASVLPGTFVESKTEADLQQKLKIFPPPGPAAAFLLALLLIGGSAMAQDPRVTVTMHLTEEQRSYFRNPPDFGGSCVQASLGMVGLNNNDMNAACLLWDTSYGKAERGGSWPSRVEAYCQARGIRAWSVTGETVNDTFPWMQWAVRTGRFAAIGANTAHFQTLYGYEAGTPRPWLMCDNNSPARLYRCNEPELKRIHAASGPWVLILEKPTSSPPRLERWWK